jgi:hypothetical protein
MRARLRKPPPTRELQAMSFYIDPHQLFGGPIAKGIVNQGLVVGKMDRNGS